MENDFYLPYLLDYSNLTAEHAVIFVIAVMAAIIVNAEGQAFVAAFLGDSRPDVKDRFHFNVFLHMSIFGTLCFLVAGFGWVKEIGINPGKFKNHPRLSLVVSRLAGPFANILLANIAASLSWILGNFGFVDKVFSSMVAVNITMAVYGLLPIPPLPGASFLFAFFPDNPVFGRLKYWLCKTGPFLLIGGFGLIRFSGWDGISSLINPVVVSLIKFTLDF
ncbi:site-2 protease family protein [Desulfomarina sp.]